MRPWLRCRMTGITRLVRSCQPNTLASNCSRNASTGRSSTAPSPATQAAGSTTSIATRTQPAASPGKPRISRSVSAMVIPASPARFTAFRLRGNGAEYLPLP